MTLVILAAGMGSRYGGLKQLDPMTDAGNFIIDFSIFDAVEAGFDRVVFIIKEENLELFRETVGNRVEKKIKVEYAFQKMDMIPAGSTVPEGRTKPLGTAHAIYCVRDLVKDNFAVINADDFYGRDTFMQLANHLRDANSENGVAHHCMIGFRLGNTLTENGTVSRGQCIVSDDGMLESVTERTKITKRAQDAAYLDDDGETWVDMPFETIVSMNLWGLTQSFFTEAWNRFPAFLDKAMAENPLKGEYFLPSVISQLIQEGKARAKVLRSTDKWYGVTYQADKPVVVAAIAQKTADGVYPDNLWEEK